VYITNPPPQFGLFVCNKCVPMRISLFDSVLKLEIIQEVD